MMRCLWLLGLLIALPVHAQFVTKTGNWQPLGCGLLPNVSSATKLSSMTVNNTPNGTIVGIPPGAVSAVFSLSGSSLNILDDGETPTSIYGVTIPVGSPTAFTGALARVSMIQTVSTATGTVCFWK